MANEKLTEARPCSSGKTFTIAEVCSFLADECAKAGSQKAWAAQNDVSASYVSEVLLGRHEPGDGILRPLGFVRATVYRPIHLAGRIALDGAREGET